MTTPSVFRCAIYTRKSSEEGLEQTFNSLDAQYEACTAYIHSQRHEGWRLLPTHYDDGGFSGGTMERPALKRLMSDIRAGKVDLVVVYKVDRLTRALNDFAKIVEQLDSKSVSFVSVTQSFNTTTSMGRLTLNVLLSFAQFEREVTGERIRDKIAASKKKGMWMGGPVPLGYDCRDRQLFVNEVEARQVRHIFERYGALGNFGLLKHELNAQGYRSKVRATKEGRPASFLFTNGALTRIVTNPIYRGLISHKGQLFLGQHDAIVPEELWKTAQANREHRRRCNTSVPRARSRNPLLGLLSDDCERTYYVSYTKKPRHSPYRYYVTKNALDRKDRARLPAVELESHVIDALRAYFADAQRVIDDLEKPSSIDKIVPTLRKLAITPEETQWQTFRPLIRKVIYSTSGLALHINRSALNVALNVPVQGDLNETLCIQRPMRLHRTGHDIRLVIPSSIGDPEAHKRNPSLIRLVAQGRKWYLQLTSGAMTSLRAIAAAEGVTERYVSRVLKGSLLAPDIVQRILDGRQPVTMTVRNLLDPIPTDWTEQRRFFGC
jgi:site-specific DNA recombinase